jgi:hypothetical protein
MDSSRFTEMSLSALESESGPGGTRTTPENKAISASFANPAHDPAHFVSDPRLQSIIDAWPTLGDDVRDDLARRAVDAPSVRTDGSQTRD